MDSEQVADHAEPQRVIQLSHTRQGIITILHALQPVKEALSELEVEYGLIRQVEDLLLQRALELTQE